VLWPIFIISVLCGFSGPNARITTNRVHLLLLAALAVVVVHEIASPQRELSAPSASSGPQDRDEAAFG
jgi:hypothetical protein